MKAIIFLISVFLSGCSPAFWSAVANGLTNASKNNYFINTSDGHKCPSCNSSMYFYGETKTEWGKLFRLYKCPSGHSYWYSSTSTSSNSQAENTCPICNMGTYFTGRTRLEWGKLQKIYKCPSGHESVK